MIEKLKQIEKMDLNCSLFTVYDMDGRTTQELLNQFFHKINSVIDTTNASLSLMEFLINGGLKEEIAQKLIEWIQDGTLDEIINHGVLKEINDKVDLTLEDIKEQRDEIEQIVFQMKDNFEFLKDAESFNVKFYGARGDGVEDDTDAFKKAIFALDYVEGGKTIFVPAGTYLITETIELPKGTALCGEANSIIKFASNNVQITVGGQNVQIKDLVFDGSDVATTNVIKDNTDVLTDNVRIENVTFRNFFGTMLSMVNLEETKGAYILNCNFDNTRAQETKCINVGRYTQNIFIKNNTFKNINVESISNKRYCIYIETVQPTGVMRDVDAVIENNHFETDIHAYIYINGSNITINNNTFITKSTFNGHGMCYLIDNTNNAKIKNNFYNLTNNIIFWFPLITVNKGSQIFLYNENIFVGGLLKISKEQKKLFAFSNCDVTMDNISVTGTHHTYSLIDISNMSNFVMRNSNIDLEGTCEVVIRPLNSTASSIANNYVTIENNNIKLFKGLSLISASTDVTKLNNIEILNNNFRRSITSNNELTEAVNIRNFKNAVIEKNIFDGDVYAYDFDKLILNSNTLGKLYVSSDTYDVLSQNNTFDGKSKHCYMLSCHSTNNCNFVSKNNYNKSNKNMIHFYSNKGTFLNVDNINVETIDDINANDIQKQNNLYITRDSNVTVDIYSRCLVKSSQSLCRFTYYTDAEPLINYRKPHGAIIYNASTGQSKLFVEYEGINRESRL